MTETIPLIERLSGVLPGTVVERALAARPDARQNAQASYELLLHPQNEGPVSLLDRRAIAAFVAALFGEPQTAAHYQALLAQTPSGQEFGALLATEATQAAVPGPYGKFPAGPLSAEDLDGPVYRASEALRVHTSPRLAAALEHAHLLALHPRDSSQAALQDLLDAGWTTAGIVVISQLVAFLSFQIRVVAGLRAVVATRQSQRLAATA